MRLQTATLICATVFTSAVATASSSFAFCGTIEKTATARSQDAATNIANNAGLREVRKLESSYGRHRVSYKPARMHCYESGWNKKSVTCNIKQNFCVKG
ncbi:MAG: hypothetical protein ABL901_13720 [Hyphomicrobiaceae bacterium]